MPTHPCCCWKQGHTVWLQVNFVALISCVHFFFVNSDVRIPFLFTIIWFWSVDMRYASIGVPLARTHGVGTTHVMRQAVSLVLSEIQHLLCACSIGNMNHRIHCFFLFQFDALCACMAWRLSDSVSRFVYPKSPHIFFFSKSSHDSNKFVVKILVGIPFKLIKIDLWLHRNVLIIFLKFLTIWN